MERRELVAAGVRVELVSNVDTEEDSQEVMNAGWLRCGWGSGPRV
jgi:hypothetical protein